MAVVSLRVENFKSFRGRHEVSLGGSALTAVVGPNGAGKSNLMEAMSFVLGVASRQLRGARLEDLVCRGTSSGGRVELVVREGDGVRRLARTISRAGVGSYRVDDSEVTRDAYEARLAGLQAFVVSQGQVEATAQKSGLELSKLVEDVSGSAAFRDGYEAARDKKVAAEEASIAAFQERKRLAAHKKSLKAQKDEATKFEKLAEEARGKKREHVLWQVWFTRTRLRETERKVRDATREVEAAAKRDADAEADAVGAKAEVVRSERAVGAEEKRLAAARRDLATRIEPAIAAKRDAVARAAVDGIEGARQDPRLAQATRQVETLSQDLAAVVSQESELRRDDEVDLDEVQREDFELLRRKFDEAADDDLRRSAALDRAAAAADAELEDAVAQGAALVRERATLVEARQATSDSRKTDEYDAAWAAAAAEAARLGLEDAALAHERVRLDTELAAVIAELADAPSGRSTAAETKVETLRRLFRGVRGRLVDVCRPTQRKYEAAVTAAAGSMADAVVVDTRACAVDCIRYLRDQRLGATHFLPLDGLAPRDDDEDVRRLPELRRASARIRPGLDVLAYDDDVAPAVEAIFGGVVVCDSLDDAKSLCYDNDRKVKAVTLSGAVFSKSGALTAGDLVVKTGGGGSRSWRDVPGLEARRADLEKRLSDVRATRRSLRIDAMPDAETKLAAVEATATTARRERATIAANAGDAGHRLEALDRAEIRHAAQVDAARARAATARTRATDAETALATRRRAAFATFAGRVRVDVDALLASSTPDAAAVKLRRQRRKLEAQLDYETQRVAQVERRLEVEAAEREATASRVAAAQRELDDLLAEAERVRAAIATADDELVAGRDRLHETRAALESLHAARAEAATAKHDASRRAAAYERGLQDLQVQLQDIARKATVEHVDLPRRRSQSTGPSQQSANTSSSSSSSQLRHVIDPDDIDTAEVELEAEDFDFEDELGFARAQADRRKDAERIARELEQLAPNLKARSLFDAAANELKAAEQTLADARDDARNAARDFEDLKTQRAAAFSDCLNQVAAHLSRLYADLTRSDRHPLGGSASLSAVDPDEPYQGGLVFHATPPTKRFCEISQLSGGERSLASLALLFALHAYKKAPFIVLDEVDAALDAHNLATLSNFLKTRPFQVIAVSHKEPLYTQANFLVGIAKDLRSRSSAAYCLDLHARFGHLNLGPANMEEDD